MTKKSPDAIADPSADAVKPQAGKTSDRPPLANIPPLRFVPIEHDGDMTAAPRAAILTVDLGGERMRCLVRKVVDPNTVVVEITGSPFTKNHSYKQGDMVGCRREQGPLGESWRAVNERVVNEIERRRAASAPPPQAQRKSARPSV